jgi:hypothetical protein
MLSTYRVVGRAMSPERMTRRVRVLLCQVLSHRFSTQVPPLRPQCTAGASESSRTTSTAADLADCAAPPDDPIATGNASYDQYEGCTAST